MGTSSGKSSQIRVGLVAALLLNLVLTVLVSCTVSPRSHGILLLLIELCCLHLGVLPSIK